MKTTVLILGFLVLLLGIHLPARIFIDYETFTSIQMVIEIAACILILIGHIAVIRAYADANPDPSKPEDHSIVWGQNIFISITICVLMAVIYNLLLELESNTTIKITYYDSLLPALSFALIFHSIGLGIKSIEKKDAD